jgi:hypothetical protein
MGKFGYGLIVAAVVAVATVGPVLAAPPIRCRKPQHGPCRGTDRGEGITGTIFADRILGRGGADAIDGDPGDREAVDGGHDRISGGRGADVIEDGRPTIDRDTVHGGRGDDTIYVDEGPELAGADTVVCGPGQDTVYFDPGVDEVAGDCEHLNPPPAP